MNDSRLGFSKVKYVITFGALMVALGPLALGQDLPVYKVDPFWPKQPLPNKWLIQGVPTMVTDKDDHIWVLNRPRDIIQGDSIQKYTADGKFLWDFGHRAPRPPTPRPAENNQQTDIFPGGIFFFDLDEAANEIYIMDAKRVLVYGYDGKFKRGWGGHGLPLSEISN